MTNRIGFIGLGNMGGPMAARLLQSGYSLLACDVRAAALEASFVGQDLQWAESPRAVAERCEVVLASLPRPEVVREAALGREGIVAGGRARLFVDLSTTGPKVAVEVAAGLAAHDIAALDAPVSGGIAGAKAGTLAIMLSGSPAARERAAPLLAGLGRIFTIGDSPGQGQMMKAMNNLLAATALAATSEALALGIKAGLNPLQMVEVINAGSGRSFVSEAWFAQMVSEPDFKAGMNCALLFKDVTLAADAAQHYGAPLRVGSAVYQLWQSAAARRPDDDFARILDFAAEAAGVEIPRPDPRSR